MNKLKITKEFELPVYVDFGGYNKIISDTEFVEIGRVDLSIKRCKYGAISIPLMLNKGELITETVFNNAYQDALSKIMRDDFLAATTPATDADIREKIEDELIPNDHHFQIN